MNNLCFGMKVLNITQVPKGNVSHKNFAVDLAGSDTGIDFWYAQGRWKCIGQWKSGFNTFFFTHIDASGNPTEIHCADGVDRLVTIAMTHCNSSAIVDAYGNELSQIKVGAIYEDGTPMYKEGIKGNATANHIHLEIAKGIQTTKTFNKSYGYYWFNNKWNATYTMRNELNPLEVFFVNDSFTRIKYDHGVTLKHVASNEYVGDDYDMKLKINCVKGAQNIRETLSFKGKKPNGKILKTVPKGTKDIIITGFVDGIQKDGYQWVKVKYGDIEGYCQWDSMYFTVYEY